MRTTGPAVAIGGLLALVAVLVVLWLTAPPRSASERADALAAQLRCPDCQGLSVADSETAAAREIRRQVAELVAGGASDDEVRAHFTDRYGEWILLAPRAPALWLVPLVAVAAGIGLLVAWLRRRATLPPAAPHISDTARRRVRDEAEALDA